MINKRWITLPVVYSRPFTSKAVFWAILKEFEFEFEFRNSQRRTQTNNNRLHKHIVWAPCDFKRNAVRESSLPVSLSFL